MKKTINIAVIDNHLLFREGLISLLKEIKEVNVLFEANNGKELVEKLKIHKPDIILLDVEMPEMNGIEATSIIRKKYPDIKILMLSMHDSIGLISSLLQKGASGYITKGSDHKLVFQAIKTISEKGFFLDENALKALTHNIADNSYLSTFNTPSLSKREIEVVKLICHEYTIKEIADKLNISPRTVDTYRENIYSKTNSKNIAGVVLYAIKNNLVN